jgi:NADH-quinone oxidoreductase subunit L
MIVSILVAISGVFVAYRMYGADNAEASDKSLQERFGYLYGIWAAKYNLDEIYEGYIGNPIVRFSDRVLAVFDMRIVDGFVNALAGTVKLFGSLFRYIQTGVTSSYAMALVIGVVIVLSVLIF